MSKFFLFVLLWWMFQNPLIAILLFFILLYFIDRRFVGLFPSLTKPLRTRRRIAALKQTLGLNPHDTSAKTELARLLIERKNFKEAMPYLREARKKTGDTADMLYDIGLCELEAGNQAEGERMILEALDKNPKVRYGEPYLKLGEHFMSTDKDKALRYLEKFSDIHSSSCATYYHLGTLYQQLGRKEEAKQAFREVREIYRTLPKYKKKSERRWYLLSRWKR